MSAARSAETRTRLLEGDWRELVWKHFSLTAEEKKGLEGTPAAKVKKIERFLIFGR